MTEIIRTKNSIKKIEGWLIKRDELVVNTPTSKDPKECKIVCPFIMSFCFKGLEKPEIKYNLKLVNSKTVFIFARLKQVWGDTQAANEGRL